MEFIAIWVGSIVLCAAVASSKGRSTVGWLFVAFLLGPLALLAVGLMPSESAATSDADAEANALVSPESDYREKVPEVQCPHCYGPVDSRATVCRHCQRDLAPAATAPAPGSLPRP